MSRYIYYTLFYFIFISYTSNAQNLEIFKKKFQDLVLQEKYALANNQLDSLLNLTTEDKTEQIDLLLKKASLFGLLKIQDSALHYLEKGIVQAQLSNNTDLLSRANTNLGMLLNQIGRPNEALTHYKKHYDFVYNLPNESENLTRKLIANYNIGLTYFKLKKIDSARTYLNEGLQLAIAENNYTGIAKINGLLSEIDFSLGKNWEKHLSLAFQAAKQNNDTIGLLKAHLTAAEFNEANGNIKKAIKQLEKAEIIIYKNPENISLWLKFHDLKYKVLKASNNYIKSLAELELYLHKKERLDSLNQAHAINIYNERIKIYEKNLKTSKLLIKQKEKINDLTFLSSLLGFVVLIGIGILFLKSKLKHFNRSLYKINRINENNTNLHKEHISQERKILFKDIQRQVNNKQLYLDHNISLNSLSQLLSSNSSYVSESINLFTGNNFSMYINKKRIDYAKVKIKELYSKKNFNFDDIAEMSGFNSKSHFYRVFKQITGLTPKQYIGFVKETSQSIEH